MRSGSVVSAGQVVAQPDSALGAAEARRALPRRYEPDEACCLHLYEAYIREERHLSVCGRRIEFVDIAYRKDDACSQGEAVFNRVADHLALAIEGFHAPAEATDAARRIAGMLGDGMFVPFNEFVLREALSTDDETSCLSETGDAPGSSGGGIAGMWDTAQMHSDIRIKLSNGIVRCWNDTCWVSADEGHVLLESHIAVTIEPGSGDEGRLHASVARLDVEARDAGLAGALVPRVYFLAVQAIHEVISHHFTVVPTAPEEALRPVHTGPVSCDDAHGAGVPTFRLGDNARTPQAAEESEVASVQSVGEIRDPDTGFMHSKFLVCETEGAGVLLASIPAHDRDGREPSLIDLKLSAWGIRTIAEVMTDALELRPSGALRVLIPVVQSNKSRLAGPDDARHWVLLDVTARDGQVTDVMVYDPEPEDSAYAGAQYIDAALRRTAAFDGRPPPRTQMLCLGHAARGQETDSQQYVMAYIHRLMEHQDIIGVSADEIFSTIDT